MIAALLVLGLVAEAAAWWWVVERGVGVFRSLAVVLVVLGGLALATGRVRSAAGGPGAATALGLAAGLALYVATRIFVSTVAPRCSRFRGDVLAAYARGGGLPRWLAVALSAALVAPAEEVFWRGLVLPEAQRAVGSTVGAAVLAWAAAILANAPSRNVAILAGAAVGGAVWVWLAAHTGGALAPAASHAVWTALMVGAPPLRPERMP